MRSAENREKGFTLIELVITMVLIGIIAFAAANALIAGARAYFVSDFQKEALDQARIAVERMSREIRTLRDSAGVITWTATQFWFVDASGNNVDFNLTLPDITRNGSTLSSDISSLTIEYLQTDGTVVPPAGSFSAANIKRIRITVIATVSGENVQLQSEAFLRNL